MAEGVNEDHARDWLKVRKAKRAPLTQTAWDGLKREASKAGLSVPRAVALCAERNWQSLDAEWLNKPGASANETTYQRNQRERMAQLAPGVAAKAPGSHKPAIEVFDVAARVLG